MVGRKEEEEEEGPATPDIVAFVEAAAAAAGRPVEDPEPIGSGRVPALRAELTPPFSLSPVSLSSVEASYSSWISSQGTGTSMLRLKDKKRPLDATSSFPDHQHCYHLHLLGPCLLFVLLRVYLKGDKLNFNGPQISMVNVLTT